MRLVLLCTALALAGCGSTRQAYEPEPTPREETSRSETTADDPGDEPAPEPEPEPDPEAQPDPAPEPEPARDPVLARVSAQDVTVDGRRPPEDFGQMIIESIGAPLEQVLECYAARLADDRGLEGDLRLRLWVSSRRVIRATVEQELADAALQVCAITRIRTLRLPASAPSAGASVRFLIRFALGPRTITPPPGVLVSEAQAEVP